MRMKYWLVKQEPTAYSWDDFVKDGKTAWTGVRNFQARNNLRSMKAGERVLFYHSVTDKAIIGEAEVVGEAFTDPTATEGNWVAVELKPIKALRRRVSLEEIKAHQKLSQLALVRSPRLSVMPVTADEYRAILALSKG
jgi:predicted RNA-binding protein with PUA-like domain